MCWTLNHQNIIEIAQTHISLSVPPVVAKRGAVVRPPHGRRSRRAQVYRIRGALLRRCPKGSYKASYAAEVVAAFLDGLVLTP
jgi:hypothetical protein